MNKFFFIGIKGAGMAPLARVIKSMGNEVLGSDVEEHVFTEDFLNEDGIKFYNFNEYDFSNDFIVIVGNSFDDNFDEVKKAKLQGNTIHYYYEFLGKLTKDYKSVAVTGTHGKTTTTTIIKNVLSVNNDVAYLIGDGNGGSCPNPDVFVFEACEYRNHFLSYTPQYAIITNVGYDHRDFFTTQAMYDQAYINFANNVSENIVVCDDDEHAVKLFRDNPKTIFYGFNSDCFVRAENVKYLSDGCEFDLIIDNKNICKYKTALFGRHNVLNLLATLTVAYLIGDDVENICKKYDGRISPKRRFEEYLYEEQIVIDDYAHHPDELKVFLSSVFQKYPDKEIIAVFEPHTIERLEDHYLSFSKELNKCHEQIILPVKIPLRDKHKFGDVHTESTIMMEHLKNGSLYTENTYNYLVNKKGCVVLFIGATISEYTEKYISKINLLFNKK